MLNILFMAKLPAEYKKAQLHQNYDIIMTQEIEEEVTDMCNLSQGLLEEGEAKGMLLTTLQYVKKLMHKINLSVEEATDLLDVDNDIRPKILEELNEKTKHK